jgi:hypothetical protein
MTTQHARPREVAELLARHGIPQRTPAKLAGLSQPALSLFLSGQRGLSLSAQLSLLKALTWLIELARGSKLPINFADTERLRPLWFEHLRLESEAQVLELANKQQQ